MTKATLNKKKNLFTSKFDLNSNEETKFYIWRTDPYGTDTWTLGRVDQKCLESSEMW
jgi:hypothetical protein